MDGQPRTSRTTQKSDSGKFTTNRIYQVGEPGPLPPRRRRNDFEETELEPHDVQVVVPHIPMDTAHEEPFEIKRYEETSDIAYTTTPLQKKVISIDKFRMTFQQMEDDVSPNMIMPSIERSIRMSYEKAAPHTFTKIHLDMNAHLVNHRTGDVQQRHFSVFDERNPVIVESPDSFNRAFSRIDDYK